MKSLISRNRNVMSGAYVIRGRRITVTWLKAVHKCDRWSVANIARQYRLTRAQVRAAVNFRSKEEQCR